MYLADGTIAFSAKFQPTVMSLFAAYFTNYPLALLHFSYYSTSCRMTYFCSLLM